MNEEEVIYVIKKETDGFRFAIIETCPSTEVPFAIGFSKTVPSISIKRFAQEELEEEFSHSLEDVIETVNEKFGMNIKIDELQQANSLLCGRRLLRSKESVVFSVDYGERFS